MPFDSMPFDPRLIHPDEPPLGPAGELDLPEDLAALAAQLADDAAHLAARFPAERVLAAQSEELAKAAERINSHALRPQARAAASLVLGATMGAGLASVAVLGLTIWLSLRFGDSLPDPVDAARSLPALAQSESESTTRPPATSGATPAAANRPSAMLSVGQLSGPELEGLFDLLDEGPPSAASISF